MSQRYTESAARNNVSPGEGSVGARVYVCQSVVLLIGCSLYVSVYQANTEMCIVLRTRVSQLVSPMACCSYTS
jgi:hypothetical protein